MSEQGSSRRADLGGPAPHGSSSRLPAPGPSAPGIGSSVDNQATVISHRAPLADFPQPHFAHPLEIGKSLEGERLGQFVLEKFVGGGGMGAVFRALDTTLNREVAVK